MVYQFDNDQNIGYKNMYFQNKNFMIDFHLFFEFQTLKAFYLFSSTKSNTTSNCDVSQGSISRPLVFEL